MTVFYLFVAIGFLLTTLLALNVSRVRIKQKITHGDKGNKLLRNAMIAHSNALEQIVPFSIILFVLVKQNTSEMMIQVLSIGFIVVRILHGIGVNKLYYALWRVSAVISYLLTIFSIILIFWNLIS